MMKPGATLPEIVRAMFAGFCGAFAIYVATDEARCATNLTIPPGFSSIADNYLDNRLSTVLPNPAPGTEIFKWNPVTGSYELAVFDPDNPGWDNDTTLAPGEGAFIYSPTLQNIVFSGQAGFAQPPPRLSPGYYLVGCRTPAPATFDQVMGFPPIVGDSVDKYDNTSTNSPQPSSTHQFTAAGWSPSAHSAGVCGIFMKP